MTASLQVRRCSLEEGRSLLASGWRDGWMDGVGEGWREGGMTASKLRSQG